MYTHLKKAVKWLLFLTPLCLGTAGFYLQGEMGPLDALFQGVCLYTLNYQDTPPNLLVELARWAAPLATAGGVLLVADRFRERLRRWLRYLRGESVAVYGPEALRQELLERMPGVGLRGIDPGDGWDLVRGERYLLLGSDEENFAFYSRNREALAGHTVYLQSATLPAQSVSGPALRLFSPEETAARLFWREHCLYGSSREHGHQIQVAFLGFGALGEKLLTYGLLNNIFDPGQHIEYHVFGDVAPFAAVHTSLSAITDPVIPHPEPWYDALPLLEGAQMVVVLTQQGQLALLRDLLLAIPGRVFHVFDAGESGTGLLVGRERLLAIPWEQIGRDPAHIFSDTMIRQAQRINLRYAQRYGGAGDAPGALAGEWEKLDSFTRYSNISAADYHQVRLGMLAALGVDAGGGGPHPGAAGAAGRAGAHPLVPLPLPQQLALRRPPGRRAEGPLQTDPRRSGPLPGADGGGKAKGPGQYPAAAVPRRVTRPPGENGFHH